ncbi:MAG: cytochrome c oxidase assembly protein [Terriglobales bacterium]|jgi:putative membrane protein
MLYAHHIASFRISGALIFAALVYLHGWLRLRRQEHNNVQGWRAGSFVLGLFLVWLATASLLAELDHVMLTAHMVQHLLLMTFAPPLILFGMPRETMAHGLPRRFLQMISRLSRLEPTRQLASVLTHPAFCWFGAASTLIVWHIPSMFALGLRSQAWHGIEQASFFATGLLFWWPVIRSRFSVSIWPESSMLLYLFLATLPCDILSGFLVFCDRVVYPVFFSSSRLFRMSALEDQQCAGALMWTCVTVVYLIAAAVFAARLLSPHRSEEWSILQLESERLAMPPDSQRMEAA